MMEFHCCCYCQPENLSKTVIHFDFICILLLQSVDCAWFNDKHDGKKKPVYDSMIFYVREWIGTENRCKNILYKNVKNIYTICFGTIKDCKNCWWSTSESKRKDINCVIIIGVKDVRNQVIIFFSLSLLPHTHIKTSTFVQK